MKKGLVIAVILGVIISVISVTCLATTLFDNKRIWGSKKMVTRTMAVPAFDVIRASRAVDVKIVESTVDQITITADDNIIDYVKVDAKDGDLLVTIDKMIQNIQNFTVTVTIPSNDKIAKLKASSAATIVSTQLMVADQFEIDASSAAKIKALVKANKCEVDASSAAGINLVFEGDECILDASSAAKIEAQLTTTECEISTSSAAKIMVSGSSKFGKLESSSAGSIKAQEFVVETLKASVSSGADVYVNCSKELTASASSGGGIKYTGECKAVSLSKSSGGSINKK